MLTLFSIIVIALLVKCKRYVYVYTLSYGLCLVCFSIAVDGNFIGFWEYMYVNDSVENSAQIIYYWAVIVISYVSFWSILRNKPSGFSTAQISSVKLRMTSYILASLSLAACCYNVAQAIAMTSDFSDARAWELAFGYSLYTNYLYFLHLGALVGLGVLVGAGKHKVVDLVLVAALLVSSGMQGIKFTILHAFVFFSFAYFLGRGERLSKLIWVLICMFVGVVVLFFVFARGGGVQGMVDYIFSASVNSLYKINEFEFYDISSLGIFNPLAFIPLEKIYARILEGENFERVYVGFLLNDLYNLEHAITKIGVGFGFGFLFYSCIFAVAINSLRNMPLLHLDKVFLLIMIFESILMFFTGFEFFKTKLWFNLIFLLILYRMICQFYKYRGSAS